MVDINLVERLAGLPGMADVPREELEWLVANGQVETFEPGSVVAPKGQPIENLYIILSGGVTIRVDRGGGPKRITGWGVGETTGMLPYSRMTESPGRSYVEKDTELLAIPRSHFPEMIHMCPRFTERTVHTMLDRARTFNTSDLQDEKLISLGKLAAGLAHELNNPASAMVRSAKLLCEGLVDLDAASRAIGSAGLSDDAMESILQFRTSCSARSDGEVLSPIERADREEEITDWLLQRNQDPDRAEALVDTAVTTEMLEALTEEVSGDVLDSVLRWACEGFGAQSLARDIEEAASRVYELVSAVKGFTYMDDLAASESVDVEAGLRNTMRILSFKANSKRAVMTLNVESDMPRVRANGGELNQVWMNLIDNAIDAIPESGRVDVNARKELDRVVVRVVDDGPGIPPDIITRVFDPFFTTKPQGEGTGLGLDIARRIVRRYQGDICLESRPGMTEFSVSLAVDRPETPLK